MGNAIYRDLIQALVMVQVDHLVLAVSNIYKYQSGGKAASSTDYKNTCNVADRGVLVQALIEDVRPPPGFHQIQAAMLMGWDGRDSGEFARLYEGIAAYAPLADSSEHPSSTYSGLQATVVEEFPLLKRLIASPISAASSTDSRRATPEQWRDLEQRFRDLKGTTLQAVLLMHPEREGSAWIINGGSKESRHDFQVLAALADSLLRKSLRTWAKIDSTDVRDSLAPSHRWLYFVKWKGAKTDRTFARKFREIANVAKASAGACAECAAYESIL
jgi:hypothetical protein